MTTTHKKEKTVVLLDAHAILHRAYHALPDFTSSKGEPTGALYGLSAMLIKIIRELSPDHIIACYDLPEPTFRHEAYGEYKMGRAKAEDALIHQINRSRDIFTAFNIPIYDKPGFEADDILGTIAEVLKEQKNIKVIIASGDMDTLQLVDGKQVTVYTLKKGINDTVIYDEAAVNERFGFPPELLADFKGLRGDPSDNIIGIAGIGEKTATTLIQNFGALEDIYKKLKKDEMAFIKAGIKPRMIQLLKDGEEEAFFSKTLATIKRDVPIEFSLPEKRWSEAFDRARVEALFAELDFRGGLRDRVREIGATEQIEMVSEEKKEEINADDLRKAQIAVWLLNSDITNPTVADILEYAKRATLKEALPELVRMLEQQGLEKVYAEIELPIVPIIERAQRHGVLVDVEHLKKLSVEYHKKLSVLESTIWKLAGEEFNINSPKQLGVVLFDKMGLSTKGLKKTAGGARSTRESELAKLAQEHEIVAHVIAYRELQKLLSTYVDNIPAMVDRDGRLHTTLNQTGTTTGRMSSNDPNMQNIPSHDGMGTEIRNAFIAPEGCVLAAFDYSQIEMRVLAVLASDEKLKEVFQKGKDVHSAVASFVFDVPESEVTKDMRRKAKVINFGIVYGMGVQALRTNLGGTLEEARAFYQEYFEDFPKIAAYFEQVKKNARARGYTQTMYGRRRYVKGISSSIPYIRAAAERAAVNAPLQGTAADIIKIAMKKADDALKDAGLLEDARLLLQIHDELLYEIKEEALPKAREIIKKAMEDFPDISVPIAMNVSTGKRWGEMR